MADIPGTITCVNGVCEWNAPLPVTPSGDALSLLSQGTENQPGRPTSRFEQLRESNEDLEKLTFFSNAPLAISGALSLNVEVQSVPASAKPARPRPTAMRRYPSMQMGGYADSY